MDEKNTAKPIIYDIAVIGAGINGCGIARDAAGRGLKTYLCDKGDIGGETSSYSSKLIHGGLRYLEFFEFGLVRKSLKERDVLMKIAPHLVHEQRFVIPHSKHLRPKWLIRLGLFIYDALHWSNTLHGSQKVSLKGGPLKKSYKHGFTYSDCVTDDHRLVIANALDAEQNGASINPYSECTKAAMVKGLWQLTIKDEKGKGTYVYAKTLVNATGPWVENFVEKQIMIKPRKTLRLVKGSHIVTNKLYNGSQAYTFQDKKGRIVFTIPYQTNYTLIGTTEEEFTGDPSQVNISDDENTYLRQVIGEYFDLPLNKDDVIWHYSGVRPLIKDNHDAATETTRGYSVDLNIVDTIPLVNVWGGKLTTYRVLAEDVLDQLSPFVGFRGRWSAKTPLSTAATPTNMTNTIMGQYPWLTPEVVGRYALSYGKNSLSILETCESMKDLGEHFGAGLHEKEVQYLIVHEWAKNAEAVLWKRTKCGLHMSKKQREYFSQKFAKLLHEHTLRMEKEIKPKNIAEEVIVAGTPIPSETAEPKIAKVLKKEKANIIAPLKKQEST